MTAQQSSNGVTTKTGSNTFLSSVYNVSTPEQCKELYDQWAATFDSDILDPEQDYVAPALVAAAVSKAQERVSAQSGDSVSNVTAVESEGVIRGGILDAGCGTGLSGVALSRLFRESDNDSVIDGLDLSPGMLAVAQKTGVYRHLSEANLATTLPSWIKDEVYDVVTCVGTLTHGHVGPRPAMGEFVRVVRKRTGIVTATILSDIWESGGYEAEVERLKGAGEVEVLGADVAEYRRGQGVGCRIVVLRRT